MSLVYKNSVNWAIKENRIERNDFPYAVMQDAGEQGSHLACHECSHTGRHYDF